MKRGGDRFLLYLALTGAAVALAYWWGTKQAATPTPPPPPPRPTPTHAVEAAFPSDPVQASNDLLEALHQGLQGKDLLKLLDRPVESALVDAGGQQARGYRETYRLPRRYTAEALAKGLDASAGKSGARFVGGAWREDPEGRVYEARYGFAGGWAPVTLAFLDLKVPRLALVIDDAGYQAGQDLKILWGLKVPATVAIIPGLEYSTLIAQQAPSNGWEVICHMPMDGHVPTPPTAYRWFLKPNTPPEKVERILSGALSGLPNCRGMNNHMGSKATEEKDLMLQTAHFLRMRGLFFLDSRTSERSVAESTMRQAGVPTGSRNVFLDNSENETAILRQVRAAVAQAKKRGCAVAIGHFRAPSLKALVKDLPLVKSSGVKLVYLSELVN